MNDQKIIYTNRLANFLYEQSQRATLAHERFLNFRREGLDMIGNLITKLGSPLEVIDKITTPINKPIFQLSDLEEFATGIVEKVFGPKYKIFNDRRTPRIPNGDLLLFHRVMKITGTPHIFDQPSSIDTEYDVPIDAWYLNQNSYPYLSFAILQEMGLQPCGFLSAWLGTSLILADQDLYFRNLDGRGELLWEPNPSGKTIKAHAQILSTTTGGGTIIQKFNYSLAVQGKTFFQGEAVFGYHQAGTMANQVGLDRGINQYPDMSHFTGVILPEHQEISRMAFKMPSGNLNQLRGAAISIKGNPQSGGDVIIRKAINPKEWFFSCHFYQDPVMPGSLGVEAIYQALQYYALKYNLGDKFKLPRFSLITNDLVSWKYRGQIIPTTKNMTIKVSIRVSNQRPGEVIIRGDASLWADQVRIYDVSNTGIRIIETGQ